MNIAIPVFRERISPRFDSAAKFLLVRVEDGVVTERTEQPMHEAAGWRLSELLTRQHVDVLLCGGIRQRDYFSIVSTGIDVYPGLIGETEDVLEAFLRGGISKDGFCGAFVPVMPRRHRRRDGRCGNGHRLGPRARRHAD